MHNFVGQDRKQKRKANVREEDQLKEMRKEKRKKGSGVE
jgi:hypothetical protein